jgi:hypothetical protein
MKIEIPNFATKKELHKFLVDNLDALTAQKCATIKYADGFGASTTLLDGLGSEGFANKSEQGNSGVIKARIIINTTNIMDSHKDVHIKGLWNKNLKENKRILHVQEHKSNEFNKIIASGDDLKASVKTYTWKELGYDAEGDTEALVFDSSIKQERNAYMFDQYLKGYVNNHSVGMQYVKVGFALNDEDYPAQKALWDKHIGDIVNFKDAEKQGYFWAVTEAKALEGSSVPLGSNPITPTLSTTEQKLEQVQSAEWKAAKAFLGIE